MRSGACPLTLDAYASLTGPPLRVEHGLNAHTGAMSEAYLHGGDAKWAGGVAEYTLPPCASNGSWASFDLRARVLHPAERRPRQAGQMCAKINIWAERRLPEGGVDVAVDVGAHFGQHAVEDARVLVVALLGLRAERRRDRREERPLGVLLVGRRSRDAAPTSRAAAHRV